jgi:type IV secretory pathway VirB10-like protein
MAERMHNIAGLFKEGKTRAIILTTIIILVIAIIAGIFAMRSRTKGVDASAGLSLTPGNIQSVPFNAPNKEYARLQEKQNVQDAKTAEQVGGSAIPTIVQSDKNAQPVPEDAGASIGFTALSREQSNTGTFAPKEFTANTTDNPKNCPIIQPESPLGTPVYDKNGRLLGYAGADGKVRDANGNIIGTVGPDGLVRDANANIIGQKSSAITGTPVYDDKNNIIGYVGPDGKVRDTTGTILGNLGPDGSLSDPSGKLIGHSGVPVYDANGKLLGFAGPDGKIRDANGNIIGTVSPDGVARDLNGNIMGKAGSISPGTPVYDSNGNIIGYVGPDGKVRDANGNVIGTIGVDGQVRDTQGNVIGSMVKPPAAVVQTPPNSTSPGGTVPITPEQASAQEAQDSYARQQAILKDQRLSQLLQQKQAAMSAQAGQLLQAWVPPAQQYVPGNNDQNNNNAGNGDNSGNGNAANGSSAGQETNPAAKSGPVFIKAGTVYYGIINTAVNSDEPGPVMATIINGPYKDARILGSLTNQGKAVMMTFNVMTTAQLPKSISINSVAIDQNTARTSLSTETDNHYLLRYGSLFAAAFVQGYAQALTTSGSTSSPTLLGQSVTTPQLSGPQKFYVALGNVGTQFSNQMNSVYSTPPTVYVAAGTAVGILFMTDVQLPTS